MNQVKGGIKLACLLLLVVVAFRNQCNLVLVEQERVASPPSTTTTTFFNATQSSLQESRTASDFSPARVDTLPPVTVTTAAPVPTQAVDTTATDPPPPNTPHPLVARAQSLMTAQPWSDMDWSLGYGTCGSHKCFYRSISNVTVGYLVARKNSFSAMLQVYSLEEELHQSFGVARLSLEEPFVVNITEPQLMLLKDYIYCPGRDYNSTVLWKGDTAVTIQRVRIVPQPYFFLGTKTRNFDASVNAVDSFRPQITDPKAFSTQFLAELERMERILLVHQDLITDFQVLVDRWGRFYWIDLDRVREPDHHIPKTLPPEQRVSIISRKVTQVLFLLVL